MGNNNLFTLIFGIFFCILGFWGLSHNWLPPEFSFIFWIMISLSIAWALIMGHAIFYIQDFFYWIYKLLNPRFSAKLKEKALTNNLAIRSVRMIIKAGDKRGHHFNYYFDDEGCLIVKDLGIWKEFKGSAQCFAFPNDVTHPNSIIYDYDKDSSLWQILQKKEWMKMKTESFD